MWGKLTERNDRTRTKIITEPHELYRFLGTPGVEVTNLALASDDVVWLSWKVNAEENVPNLPHTNEVIGAYVTAGVRIYPYSFLDRIQENAIFCDTDYVIFIQPSVEPWAIATGEKLGYMQTELNHSEFIVEFASAGPKNYEYRLIINEGEKTVCKVRVITLNYHASKMVNFEVIKAMILGQDESVVNVHTEHKIKRKRRAGGVVDVVTEPENKRYRISFFKRRRMLDHSSVPLGYIYRAGT